MSAQHRGTNVPMVYPVFESLRDAEIMCQALAPTVRANEFLGVAYDLGRLEAHVGLLFRSHFWAHGCGDMLGRFTKILML